MRPRVLLLSPFKANEWHSFEDNITYLHKAMKHSIGMGEAPFASHMMYTTILNDGDQEQRKIGLDCEHSWLTVAQYIVAYTDYGISDGMRDAIWAAGEYKISVVYRGGHS